MAAQFVTPEAINFMAKEARGWICLALSPERCEALGLELMTAKNESALQTPFTVTIEARARRHHGRLRARPRAHDAGRGRPRHPARGPRAARARQPAEGEGRGGAGAHRPHRGERRPRAPRGPDPGRGDLRDHERGRLDGARPRPRRLLRAPRAEDGHDRRPDRLPAAQRQARGTRRRDAPADRLRGLRGRRLPLARGREAPRGARQGRGLRAPRRARAGALGVPHRATSSTRCAATAASSSKRRSR